MATLTIVNPEQPTATVRTGHLEAQHFQRFKEQRLHVLAKPEFYIGAKEQVPRQTWLYDFTNQRLVNSTITFPEAAERTFLEILSNAGDNVWRSLNAGVDPGKIEVTMDRANITIRSGGTPIPVEIHPTEGEYVPSFIFGSMLSGSNYQEGVAREGSGTFGVGAKATSIFSIYFIVIVGDAIRKRKFTQVWSQNMGVASPPQVEENYTGESFVQITFTLDLPRFGYAYHDPNTGVGGYPDEAFNLYGRHVADLSFNCNIACTFNGQPFNMQDIRTYAKLYFGEAAENAIVHYQWPEGTETTVKKGVDMAVNPAIKPIAKMCFLPTPDAGAILSFVNAMHTADNGVHVTAAQKALSGPLLDVINGTGEKAKGKKGKGTKPDAKPVKLTLADVQPHISMLVSCYLVDPKFKGNAKSVLSAPVPRIELKENVINKILKWDLINKLYQVLAAKEDRQLAKTDGKKKKHVFVEKGQDANEAGGAQSINCSLIIVEGLSAMGYAETLLSCMPQGRDFVGVCPIKGKMRNVRNATPQQIAENAEIVRLKKMTGLREGVDYRVEENLKTLRYGYILIMTDADHDGSHIKGLILNWLECRHPTLLAAGRVLCYDTPILRVTKGNAMFKFYTQAEYEQWKRQNADYASWKHKYYKGLATSKDSTVKEDYATRRMVLFHYDEKAPEALHLAFDEKMVPSRKNWIAAYRPDLTVPETVPQFKPISGFIHQDFIQYAVLNIHRSIPALLDGLKESQRKLLHAAIEQWKSSSPDLLIVKRPNEMKVSQFANHAGKITNYHHGEVSLSDTAILMGQRYVGSNNLPYFNDDGQFGSRSMCGEDAGDPRYLFTFPEWWINHVYSKADLPIMTRVVDEGDEVEPVRFLPIIPMCLVNGMQGIGTGHSTFVPNHNPLDLVAWLRARLTNQTLPAVWPWYRGFEGSIEVKQRGAQLTDTAVAEAEQAEAEQEAIPVDGEPVEREATPPPAVPAPEAAPQTGRGAARLSMVTKGIFEVNQRGDVVITGLPIGRSTQSYRDWIKQKMEAREITNYRDQSIKDVIHFTLVGFKNPTHQNLKLQKSYGMTNMVLLDMENRPVKYNSATDILEAYYVQRLPYYEARRQHLMAELQRLIARAQNKAKFILAVLTDQIAVKRVKKAVILARMRELEIGDAEDVLRQAKIHELSEEDIAELQREIETYQQQWAAYNQTTCQAMWLADLQAFETAYRQHYN